MTFQGYRIYNCLLYRLDGIKIILHMVCHIVMQCCTEEPRFYLSIYNTYYLKTYTHRFGGTKQR